MKIRLILLIIFLAFFLSVMEWFQIEKTQKTLYINNIHRQTKLIRDLFNMRLQYEGLNLLSQTNFNPLNNFTESLILMDENHNPIYKTGNNIKIHIEEWKNNKIKNNLKKFGKYFYSENIFYHDRTYDLLIFFKPLNLLSLPKFRNLAIKLFLFNLISGIFIFTVLLIRLIEPLLFLERYTRGGIFHKEEFDRERPITRLMSQKIRETFGHIEEIRKHFKSYEEKVKKISTSNIKLNDEMIQITTKQIHELDQRNFLLKKTNERLLYELEMAKRVQLGIIPNQNNFDTRNEFRIDMKYTPMEDLGGDLIDIIRAGKNGYAFLVADVSGHGIAAALISTMAKVSFNDHSGWKLSPANICETINNELCHLIGDLGYYLTAFYGVLNLEESTFTYTNAGHPSALYYNKASGKVSQLPTTGTILGIFENIKYREEVLKLHPGDRILFYTDGIIETRNSQDELYGIERLMKFFERNNSLDIHSLVQRLTEQIQNFSDHRRAEDDRVILIMEYIASYTQPKIAKT